MDSIVGISAREWLRALKDNHFRISPDSWLKVILITFLSIKNARQKSKEHQLFAQKIKDTEIQSAPLFLLGHWRSGTTFLHNLIALDKQFAFPNLFEIRNPHSFLQKEKLFQKRMELYSARKRMMDNIQVALNDPAEEEFALAVMTLQSPLIGWMFPRRASHYEHYTTFDSISEDEIKQWKAQYLFYLKKLTFKYAKPLLLKSPVNTARIRLLAELFPGAKFIHIHRHPYDVFRSTKKLYTTAVQAARMQAYDKKLTDSFILDRYHEMYQAYWRDIAQIPAQNKMDIAFEELEKYPEKLVSSIYQTLNLSGYDKLEPVLKEYLRKQADYKKNTYKPIDEALKEKIKQKWQFSFDKWGYDA